MNLYYTALEKTVDKVGWLPACFKGVYSKDYTEFIGCEEEPDRSYNQYSGMKMKACKNCKYNDMRTDEVKK